MLDFCYKIARKSIPRFFYELFRSSYFGRRKFWETIDPYRECFLKYQEAAKTGFKNKTVLEVGSGDQIFTALFFLNQGCRRVILVDPKIEIINNSERLASCISVFKTEYPKFSLSASDVKARVLAEKDLRNIADNFNNRMDFIFSHQVLEHFQDLDGFYSNVRRLLAKDGICVNRVDLSDHTYHIFSRFKFLHSLEHCGRLRHLKYSDKTFAFLNDPKCYMNRKPLPLYCQKAKAYNLKCRITEKVLFDRKVKVHKDVVKKLDAFDKEDLNVLQFWMVLEKE
jgi:SAM-dependent methyltransferase